MAKLIELLIAVCIIGVVLYVGGWLIFAVLGALGSLLGLFVALIPFLIALSIIVAILKGLAG